MRPSAARCCWPLCLLVGSLLPLTHASQLQVLLADTGAPLTPQEEAALFSRHPEAAGYRVLRWEAGAARGRRARREVSADSSLRLHLPLQPGHVELVLQKNSIAAPDFESKSQHASVAGEEAQKLTDCFYTGGSSVSWAVVSTCDGLSGLLLHGGKTYRVEELPPPPLHHHQGDPDPALLVIFPLSLASTATSDTANLTSVRSDLETQQPPSEEHTQTHRRTRARRRVTGKRPSEYTMELVVFIDEPLISHVRKRYPTANPRDKAEEIVMTLLNVVSRVFSDPSLGSFSVKLLVRELKFLDAGVVSEASGDGNAYLTNFCVWQAESTSKREAKRWDHALLLTGVDLYSREPQSTTTTGMSFIGGMCSARHSCSIVEGTKFTSAFTIAHEMGHSMNLVHDGEKSAATCSKTGYLMATMLNDGGHTWSPCSKKQLKHFLRSQGTCLAEEGGGRLTYPIPDEELPGRKFDADQQCHYMFGKGWSHAPDHHPDVCQEIWCYKGQRLRSPGVSPLDGTTCGRNKVCIKGRCKSSGAAKNQQYRSSNKKHSEEGKEKKLMRKIVKKVMKKVKKKKKTRLRNEKKTDGLLEKVEDDERRENDIGNVRKDENDEDTSEEKTEKKIRPSSKYVKVLGKMLREAKKTMKITERNMDTNSTMNEEKANPDDDIKETNQKTSDETQDTDTDDQGVLRQDKDEKKQAKNKKLKRMIKQQVKKRLNSISGQGKGKTLPRFRKVESPTQIIIKERLNYVKDKGWKVNVLKIKKTKKLANRRVKVKDYTIACNEPQSKCRITTKRDRKKGRMRQKPPIIRKNIKVTRKTQQRRLPLNILKKMNVALGEEKKTASVLTRKTALATQQCQPRKIRHVKGKGWLVKVSHACFRLQARKSRKT